MVPLKEIEYGFGSIIIRPPYTPMFYLLKGDYGVYWVAVKELKLSYHNGYIYIVNNRVSPIYNLI